MDIYTNIDKWGDGVVWKLLLMVVAWFVLSAVEACCNNTLSLNHQVTTLMVVEKIVQCVGNWEMRKWMNEFVNHCMALHMLSEMKISFHVIVAFCIKVLLATVTDTAGKLLKVSSWTITPLLHNHHHHDGPQQLQPHAATGHVHHQHGRQPVCGSCALGASIPLPKPLLCQPVLWQHSNFRFHQERQEWSGQLQPPTAATTAAAAATAASTARYRSSLCSAATAAAATAATTAATTAADAWEGGLRRFHGYCQQWVSVLYGRFYSIQCWR